MTTSSASAHRGAAQRRRARARRPAAPSSTCPIAIAQHRTATRTPEALAELLQHADPRPVRDVEDKMAIEPGHVYIAPPDYHLLVERGTFALSVDERVQYAGRRSTSCSSRPPTPTVPA